MLRIMSGLSRRAFLGTASASPMAAALHTPKTIAQSSNAPRQGAIAARIALSDVRIIGPVSRSEAGMPLGNGIMGCVVWTVPSGLRMQINRVDVYASRSASESFIEPHKDYCGGCAFVDIDVARSPLATPGWTQHLSVHDGVLTIETSDLTIHVVPDRAQDVLAIQIEDRA